MANLPEASIVARAHEHAADDVCAAHTLRPLDLHPHLALIRRSMAAIQAFAAALIMHNCNDWHFSAAFPGLRCSLAADVVMKQQKRLC